MALAPYFSRKTSRLLRESRIESLPLYFRSLKKGKSAKAARYL
jgi:hypothetical protein